MVQMTPVLNDSVTVQQYLEAETRRQVQSIKVTACCSSVSHPKLQVPIYIIKLLLVFTMDIT